MLTTDQKGAIAEATIVAAAIEAGIGVARLLVDERYIPFGDVSAGGTMQLRLSATRNNQKQGIRWASQYEFAATLGRQQGAIAQLGERLHGMQEVTGSSPVGSTLESQSRPPQELPISSTVRVGMEGSATVAR